MDKPDAPKPRSPADKHPKPRSPEPSPAAPAVPPDYDVGYKKPPRRTRFKKGKSGNPKGRPPDSKNLPSIIENLLEKPVTISIDGVPQQVAGREAIAIRIFQKALSGDAKAIEILRETDRDLEQKLRQMQAKSDAEEESSKTDQEILKHFLEMHDVKPKKDKGGRNGTS